MNQLMRFEDLREWLMSQIDGSEETRGDDSLISHFIRQIDALPSEIAEPRGCPTPGACSCPGTIPDAERKKVMDAHMLAESIVDRATVEMPVTQALVSMLEAGWLSLGSSAPGAVKPLIETLEAFERELIDIKGRLLPQYMGRAERAEKERQMAVVERDEMLEKLIAARSAMQQAYGCLWRYVGASNPMFLQARKMLLARLTKEQQASGIRYANELFGPTTEHEILHSDCSHDAAPSATAATDRPDWAQQLPGAEIFDRAARYEYIRTLNPRKFSALYNEALMGVHQFDDLVDRYRDAGEKP